MIKKLLLGILILICSGSILCAYIISSCSIEEVLIGATVPNIIPPVTVRFFQEYLKKTSRINAETRIDNRLTPIQFVGAGWGESPEINQNIDLVIDMLIKKNIDLNATSNDKIGMGIIHQAIGDAKLLELIIQKNADVNLKIAGNSKLTGLTPLAYVRFLKKKSQTPEKLNQFEDTLIAHGGHE